MCVITRVIPMIKKRMIIEIIEIRVDTNILIMHCIVLNKNK
jgi:hypothetical protein